MTRRLLFIEALLASTVCLSVQQRIPSNTIGNNGLHSLAVKAGKLYFGTATETNNFADEAYMRIVNNTKDFGIIVPENSQKWEATQPRPDRFTFVNSDRVRRLADSNRQMFRCHALTWFSQLPSFVETTQWTRETLTAAIESHIANVVGHFAGQCYAWDVVNEAVNENGTFRNSVFFRILGTDFVPISFRAAAAADPAAKLYYNDFNVESPGDKATAALGIVRRLKDAGVRIDGVGFQGHFIVGQTPTREQLAAQLNRFTALGVEVSYTELDIRHPTLPATDEMRRQQARDYVSVVGACLDVPACVGVIVWQHSDKYSWIPSTFPGQGDACLFDSNMTAKPAYTAVSNLLAIAAASAAAVSSVSDSGAAVVPAATPTTAAPVPSGPRNSTSRDQVSEVASIVTGTTASAPLTGGVRQEFVFSWGLASAPLVLLLSIMVQ